MGSDVRVGSSPTSGTNKVYQSSSSFAIYLKRRILPAERSGNLRKVAKNLCSFYYYLPLWDSGRLRLTCNQDAHAHRRFESGQRLNRISIVYEADIGKHTVKRGLVRTAGNLD